MKHDQLEARMRVLEESTKLFIPRGAYIVVRLDGRGFSKLTENPKFELSKPFDHRFREMMINTTADLIDGSGFQPIYAYTQSDEISLLLGRDDDMFNRNVSKIASVLAGEASAAMSVRLQDKAVFDGRTIAIVYGPEVVDYFGWRMRDAQRNAVNSACFWWLVGSGMSRRAASKALLGMGQSDKLAFLQKSGILVLAEDSFGTEFHKVNVAKIGTNPKTGKQVVVSRSIWKRSTASQTSIDYLSATIF